MLFACAAWWLIPLWYGGHRLHPQRQGNARNADHHRRIAKTVAQARGLGENERSEHALAGVGVEPHAPEDLKRLKIGGGVVVTEMEPGSSVDLSGLQQGDIIRDLNRKRVRTVEDFERFVDKLKPRALVLLLVQQDKATIFRPVKPK
ncbi:MAG TPA: PDZ domain-containing protein [Nitrospiraceae bacterium]|nr:PDZ domain-containing protein [Nitrospiraceae bacterium]